MNEITEFLEAKYTNALGHERQLLIAYLERLWKQFEPYADTNKQFVTAFTSGCESAFQQRYWEMLMCDHLIQCGYKDKISSEDSGPDFKVNMNGQTVWIECVAPEKDDNGAISDFYNNMLDKKLVAPDHDIFFKRWKNKGLDKKLKKIKKYIKKGIINPKVDAVVIAINSGILGPVGGLAEKGYPKIVNLVYDNNNKKLFCTKDGKIISAIIGSSATPEKAFRLDSFPLNVVYNRDADVALEHGKFGGRCDYWMDDSGKIQVTENNKKKEAA